MPSPLRTLLLTAGLAISAAPAAQARRAPAATTEAQLQRASFEYAWERIRDTYPYPDMRGLDWDAVRAELLPEATRARSAEALRPVLRELFARLGESHFGVIPSRVASVARAPTATQLSTASEPGSAGLDVRLLDDGLVVTRVDPGGGAERAGLQPGDVVEQIGDTSIAELLSLLREDQLTAPRLGMNLREVALHLLAGPAGASVAISTRGADGATRVVAVERTRSEAQLVQLGSLPPFPVLFSSTVRDDGVGIVAFNAFLAPIPDRFTEAMKEFDAAGVSGVIIDLRGNVGGVAPLAMGMAGHIVCDPGRDLGTMQYRHAALKLAINPRNPCLTAPVAVIVDELSVSTAEILAAGLQSLGRARVIGVPSAGMALPSTWERLPNGDSIQFVTADFTGPDGVRIEGRGALPDDVVPLSRDALRSGGDPQLNAAVAWIQAQERP